MIPNKMDKLEEHKQLDKALPFTPHSPSVDMGPSSRDRLSYKSERVVKSISKSDESAAAETRIFKPQHRFTIKKSFELPTRPLSGPRPEPANAAALSHSNSKATSLYSSSVASEDHNDECRCLPILERDVGIFGSTSTTDGAIVEAPKEDDDDDDDEQGYGEEEYYEENKDDTVKKNFTFNDIEPELLDANNRFSGIGFPSPKTEATKLRTPVRSLTPPANNTMSGSPGSAMVEDNERISPTPQPASREYSTVQNETEPGEDEKPVSAPLIQNHAPSDIDHAPPQRTETNDRDSYLATNKALLDLFAPIYEKRSKIVTYNETARLIRSLQDTPPGAVGAGVVKVNSLESKFQTTPHSASSLKNMITTTTTAGGLADTIGPLSPRSIPNTTGFFNNNNNNKEDQDHDNDGASAERRLSTELSRLLIRNDQLRKELLQPITLPPSTFSREYKLLITRWTTDNKISPSQAEKRYIQHVNENIDDANEAYENAFDTWMFKRIGGSKYSTSGGGQAEDEVVMQMTKDEIACAKARKVWYRGFRRRRRRERWRRFWMRVIDVLLCRSKEREGGGPLVEVLRKMSEDEGWATGVKGPTATMRDESRKGSRGREVGG